MHKVFRVIKRVFLGLVILSCFAIPIMGLVSTTINYHGVCYDFTGSQSACSWWEFTRNEMFWASFILIPLLFLMSVTWLAMAGVQFAAGWKKRRTP